ncbi:DUF3606 domain-containing protein, partial [Clostridium butyricum]|nr:DUF3606 domain-containing protein [Clostridium butyricum]
ARHFHTTEDELRNLLERVGNSASSVRKKIQPP